MECAKSFDILIATTYENTCFLRLPNIAPLPVPNGAMQNSQKAFFHSYRKTSHRWRKLSMKNMYNEMKNLNENIFK